MSSKRTGIALAVIGFLAATAFIASAPESTKTLAPLPSPSFSASTPAPSPSAPKPFLSTDSSGVLVLADDQALYYNDQDTGGAPACMATCAEVWHPVLAPTDKPVDVSAGVIGIVSTTQRADGTTQVTYNSKLLYTFTVDAPGNVTGDGIIDVFAGQAFSWHVATATSRPVVPVPSPSLSPAPLPVPSPSVSASPSRAPTR